MAEPTAIMLMGSGLVAVAAYVRKWRVDRRSRHK